MILADKIITLRKKNGWSQEELAEKLGVTRQSVSKWEGAQSVPDLERILLISKVFGVSTDYLLKDDAEDIEYVQDATEDSISVRHISMEEANEYLELKEKSVPSIAIGTFLCILAPAVLIFFGALTEFENVIISENVAGGLGMISLFILIASGVGLFISSDAKTKKYDFLEKEKIETAYGVAGMVKERQKKFEAKHTQYMIIGTMVCILSVVALFAAAIFDNDALAAMMLPLMLVGEGIGVTFFIRGAIPWESMEKLLQEGDYTVEKKRNNGKMGVITTVYWLLVTAGFLTYNFLTNNWESAGIIWPVAGVIYAAIAVIGNAIIGKQDK
ncbi:MAG: helix-turn-helix transcriptional regulator [Lachnospiraceae bacterium]|nr:helix-turn-helix transcriptional regulator [Lachnospiraceae bacterium]